MAKIIGNTTAMPNPRPDWNQADKSKADFIKNKPFGTEIITRPVGELYAEDGNLTSGLYTFNHSLGMEPNKTYTVDAYIGEQLVQTITIQTASGSTIGLSEQSVVMMVDIKGNGDMQVGGVDKAFSDLSYSDSHCLIANIDSDITKMVINGLPNNTYDKVIHHKVSQEYLDISVDQEFNEQSLNAQSGVAVGLALNKIKDKFPGSVITEITAPTTLGDQHIKAIPYGGNSSTHPSSSYYQVYTEGIGLNSDLNTDEKKTLVGAINENTDNINTINDNINAINEAIEVIDTEKLTIEDMVLKLKSNDALYTYNKQDDVIDTIQFSDQGLNSGEVPQIIYEYLLSKNNVANNEILIASTYDGLAILNSKEGCIYLLTDKGFVKVIDYSNDIYYKTVYAYVTNEKYSVRFVAIYDLQNSTYQFVLCSANSTESYAITYYTFLENGTIAYHRTVGEDLFMSQYNIEGVIHWNNNNHRYYSEQLYQTKANEYYARYSTSTGVSQGNILHTSTDTPNNFRTILTDLSSSGIFVRRYVDQNGVEKYKATALSASAMGTCTTGTEHTIHSTYSMYNGQLVCLTSAGELIFRRISDGLVMKRVSLIDSEIDFANMQNCVTQVYADTLYIWQGDNMFVLDITLDTPVVSKVNVEIGYDRMKIINNTLYIPAISENGSITAMSLKKPLTYTGLQPDWLQNDPTASTYIQNRPFYSETVTTDYIPFTYANMDSELGEGTYKQTIGLDIDKSYTVDIITDASTETVTLEAVELSGGDLGEHSAVGLTLANKFKLYDGVVVVDKNTYASGDGAIYIIDPSVKEVRLQNFQDTNIVHHKIPGEYIEQTDWNENDPESPAYIKNRTHWKEETEVDYLTLPYIEPIPDLGLGAYGKKIGLEVGKTYTVDFEVNDGNIVTLSATAINLPESVFGVAVPGVVFLYIPEGGLQILDGVDGDVTKGEIYPADNCYYTFNSDVVRIKIHGLSGIDTVIHKIPNEYIDIDHTFNPNSLNAQSAIAIEKMLDDEINPYIYKGKLKYLGETTTTNDVYQIDITRSTAEDIVFNLRRVFIHIEIPEDVVANQIIVQALVDGANIYQQVTPNGSPAMRTQEGLSSLIDVEIEPTYDRTIFVTYGIDNTGSSYAPVGNSAVPRYSYYRELVYGNKVGIPPIRGIRILGSSSMPTGTKIEIWGESEI